MGNSLILPDGSGYEMLEKNQIRADLKLAKSDKKNIIQKLKKKVQELTEELWNEAAKLEGYKKQNKDLAIMIGILKAEDTILKQENAHLRFSNCLLLSTNREQSGFSSLESPERENQCSKELFCTQV
jgi:hypothetical protein